MGHRVESAGRRGISVVIPHYGPTTPTLGLVERLRAQSYPDPVQIIVADDCSPQPFPAGAADVVHRCVVNRGFGATVNAGAAWADHDLLLVLNSDLEPEPDFLERLVEAAEPFLPALCSPALLEPGGSGGTAYRWPNANMQAVGALHPLARFQSRPWFDRWIMSDPAAQPGANVMTPWVAGACLLVPTQIFRSVGGFDESFYMFGEDADLCRRLAEAGVPSVFLGQVDVRHHHGASSDPRRVGRWNAHARFRYAYKWGFRRRLGAGLAGVMVINFGYNVARLAARKDVHPVERLRYEWDLLSYGWSGRDPRDD